jgi:hypothetical protein
MTFPRAFCCLLSFVGIPLISGMRQNDEPIRRFGLDI